MNTYFYISIIFIVIAISTSKYKSKQLYSAIFDTSIIFIYFIFTILYFLANYFTNDGINDAVIYTIQYGLQGAGFGEYILLISLSILSFIILFALSYIYFHFILKYNKTKAQKLKGFIHNIFLIFAFLFHPFLVDIYTLYKKYNIEKSLNFTQYYKQPKISDTANMNMVYIYAESLERTYFDERIFPNLVDNLKKLRKKSIDFTNINQAPSTGWTIAGIVSTQCAIPLFMSSNANSMGNVDSFLSGATCLGDILKNLDYHLVYLQGGSNKFSGTGNFFLTHKFDEIYGKNKLKNALKNKSYMNGWGLYDDSTLNIALKKYKKISKENKKFALIVSTLDTHHPNGHSSKSCKDIPYKDGKNSILNAVHCSDYLISKFIKEIQNSKYANKTIIVLTSDHLAMKNRAINLLSKGERKDLFLIFDPREKSYITIKKKGSMLDVTPTVLSKLGVNTNLGFGRNLLTKKSLYSSFDDFDQKLLSWRNNIIALWEFPKITKNYDINVSNQKLYINNHTYNFPILVKIHKSKKIEPIFETLAGKTFFEYLKEFKPTQKFIWIDRCKKINSIFNSNYNSKFCELQGSLASKTRITELKEDAYNIKTNNFFKLSTLNMQKYHKNIKKLETLIICNKGLYMSQCNNNPYSSSLTDGIEFNRSGYPNFIEKVSGISKKEDWGRWSDANLADSINIEFKKKLPTKFMLELNVGAYGVNIGKKVQIIIGTQTKTFIIKNSNPQKYNLLFENINSNIIKIIPFNPISPTFDYRKLAIGFSSLKIKPLDE